MRLLIVLCVLFAYTSVEAASNFVVPRKFRGRYKCEMPAYEINHNGVRTPVEAAIAILLVYKTKIIFRIGERSFPANVERKGGSNKNPEFKCDFPAPFHTGRVTFNKKGKSAKIDLPIFKDCEFVRIK